MEECAEALLQAGADINAYVRIILFASSSLGGQDVYGSTPLHLAVFGHAHRLVRVLTQSYGADPLLRTTKGLTAREMCMIQGGGPDLEALLEAAEEMVDSKSA